MKKGDDVIINDLHNIPRPELIELGNHVAIDAFFHCTTKLIAKDYVHIGPHVSIIGGKDVYCQIGNFSGMAAGCRIICASDEYLGEGLINPIVPEKFRDKIIIGPVILEDFVTLGTNVIVLPKITLAQGTVVAAGSIVTKNTLPWHVYAGNPAAKLICPRPKEKMLAYAKELGYNIAGEE